MLKRHVGFGAGADGIANTQDDISSIYIMNNYAGSGAATVSAVVDVAALSGLNFGTNPRVGSSPANDLAGGPMHPNVDYDVYGNEARIGIGDIEVSADGKTLYVMNLKLNKLVLFDVSNPTSPTYLSSYDVPTPSGCVYDYHPWAIGIHGADVYVGGICTPQQAIGQWTDLFLNTHEVRAYVQHFTGSGFTTVDIDSTSSKDYFSMDYDRLLRYYDGSGPLSRTTEWVAWYDLGVRLGDDSTEPQPMLTGIDFTDNGSMVLAFSDRTGFQTGYGNALEGYNLAPDGVNIDKYHSSGDLLQFCNVGSLGSPSYAPEGAAGCLSNFTPLALTNTPFVDAPDDQEPWFTTPGLTGTRSLYYNTISAADVNAGSQAGHTEIPRGGVAVLPGSNSLAMTAMNPLDHNGSAFYSGGFRWLNTTSGVDLRDKVLHYYDSLAYWGKGAGLGDVQLLTDPAPIEIGNRVWDDQNANGIQDAGEPGLNGVTVNLQTPSGISSTITSGDGNYYFDVLPGTAYTITIPTTPAGKSLTTANAGALDGSSVSNNAISDTIDSDAALVGGTATITYTTGTAGQSNHGLDIGFTGALLVGQVDIVNTFATTPTPTPVPPTATSTNTPVPPTATPTPTNTPVPPTATSTPTNTPVPTLVNLGNQVWYDTNDNGLLDAGEAGVNGVVVELYKDTNGDGIFTPGVDAYVGMSTTANGGYYTFTGLAEGGYVVVITSTNFAGGALTNYLSSDPTVSDPNGNVNNDDNGIPTNGYVASQVVTLTVGSEPSTTVASGDSNWTVDFGFYKQEIGNTIWVDANNDGQLNNGEQPYTAGPITVTLVDGSGKVVSETTTTTGIYTFTGVPSGTYVVSITVPAGYVSSTPTTPTVGVDGNDNGSPSGAFIVSEAFTATPGTSVGSITTDTMGTTSNPSIDFGLVPQLNLGNQVWYDTNDNGLLDAGEAGVNGVVVELYKDTNGDGIFTPGVDTPAGTTTTASGGYYTFTGLAEGGYVVVITSTNFAAGGALTNYLSSDPTVNDPNGNVNNDDNGIPTNGYVASQVVTLTVGSEPSTTVASGDSNWTVDFGFYKQEIGNTIWVDANNDGVLNNGEQPYTAGPITVTLVDGSGKVVSETTTTTGIYTFTGVPSGTYVVSITVPAGYVSSTPTTPTVGVDGNDNGSPSGAFIVSEAFTATPGTSINAITANNGTGTTSNPSIDFGLVPKFDLGNRVWFDTDNSGTQNGAEVGVAGVTVTLMANGAVIATQVTGVGGYYLFTDLLPGTYSVTVAGANFLPGGKLYQYVSSTPDDPSANTDMNDNGLGTTPGANGVSSVNVTLGLGLEPLGETDGVVGPNGDANGNNTIDFGFYQLTLGNQVWVDANRNGVSDDPVDGAAAGVVITAVNQTDGKVFTTTTDANGYYTLTGLTGGTYVVSAQLPDGYVSTTPDNANGAVNMADLDDSGNGTGGGVVSSAPFALQPGVALPGAQTVTDATGTTANIAVDFGMVKPVDMGDLPDSYQTTMSAGGPYHPVVAGLQMGSVVDTEGDGQPTSNATGDNVNGLPNDEDGVTWPPLGTMIPGATVQVTVSVTAPGTAYLSGWIDWNGDGMFQSGEAVTLQQAVTSGDVVLNVTIPVTASLVNAPNTDGLGARFRLSTDSASVATPVGAAVDGEVEDYVISYGNTPLPPAAPMLTLVKYTNGYDADTVTGPVVKAGDVVTWTYVVENTGNVPMTVTELTDDKIGAVSCNPATLPTQIAVGGVLTCTASGTAVAGQYTNTGVVSGTSVYNPGPVVTAENPSHYIAVDPKIELKKYTNGYDADLASDPMAVVPVGGVVTWTYVVTNTGNVDLTSLTLVDSVEGGITCPVTSLAVGATTTCVKVGLASVMGLYTNTAVVSGTPVLPPSPVEPQLPGYPPSLTSLPPVTATNPSHYTGVGLNLGNQVWLDTNNDGLIDNAEAGKDGVVVELYKDVNGDGKFTPGVDGAPIAVSTTLNGGYYTFTNLMPGEYVVVVTGTNFVAGGALVDYRSSTPTEADPDTNIDNNDNGVETTSGNVVSYVSSGAITLNGGTEPSQTVAAGDSNWTVDFGFYKLVLGDRVWNDVNNDGKDNGVESGMPGIPVTLTDVAGNVISTTLTDASGYYTFTGMPAGDYIVKIGAPAGYLSSSPDGGDPDNNVNLDDNGVGNGTGEITSLPITLQPGTEPVTDNATGTSANPTVDFGLYMPYALGNRLFIDYNNDGLDNDAYSGIGYNGASVWLYRASDPSTPIMTTTTDNGGHYLFANLGADEYIVAMQIPDGFGPSTGALGMLTGPYEPAPDPDANPADGDDNGTRSVTNAAVMTAVVTIGDASGAATEPTGELPSGFSGPGDTALADGRTNLTVDFGIYPALALGNRVWFDYNDDGRDNDGAGHANGSSTGVDNVLVQLFADDGDGVFTPGVDTYLMQVTTSNGGYYTFTGLQEGAYLVVITTSNFLAGAPLAGYQSSDINGTLPDNNINFDDNGLTVGQLGQPDAYVASNSMYLSHLAEPANDGDTNKDTNWTMDFGFYRLVLGDRVWRDDNDNGLQDAGEVGMPNVPVTLTDAVGNVISTTMTDGNGIYTFTGLMSGTYKVEITVPNGYRSSTDTATSATPDNNNPLDDNGIGVAPGVTTITSGIVTLRPGTEPGPVNDPTTATSVNPTVDFGLVPMMAIGNRVWFDTNDNGVLDVTELPVNGVAMELYRDTNGNGVFDPGVDVLTRTMTTANGGYYTFTNLVSGTYFVVVTQTNFVGSGVLVNYQSSDPTIPESNNAADDNKDHGYPVGMLGGTGYVSATVVLIPMTEPVGEAGGDSIPNHLDDNTQLTIDFGFYKLSVGNLVWNDPDKNGLYDPSTEAGVGGVTVTLTNLTTGMVYTTVTDGAGLYTFTNLLSGTYQTTIYPPKDYVSTTPDEVDPNLNGDNNDNGLGDITGPAPITTNPYTLWAGDPGAMGNNVVSDTNGSTYNPTIDFGIREPLAIGDVVWFDLNDNGVQDGTEAGVTGVTVVLWASDASGNPVTPLLTTTTSITGFYIFTDLVPGNYVVQLPPANFAMGGSLYQYLPSDPRDTNPNDDAVNDNVGGPIGALGVVSPKIVLAPNVEPVGEGVPPVNHGDNDTNQTVDFGFYQLSVGNRVWVDTTPDNVDGGEPGYPGLVVTLTNTGTGMVYTTTTDPNGYYTFTGVPSGTYAVSVTLPPNYKSVADGALPPDSVNLDDDGVGTGMGTVSTVPFALTPGAEPVTNPATGYTANRNVDFGLLPPVLLGNHIWIDTDVTPDGVYQPTDTPLQGVIVTATDASGNVYTGTTDANGVYTITVPANAVYTVTYEIPTGYMPSNAGTTGTGPGTNDTNHTIGLSVPMTTVNNLNIDFAIKKIPTAIDVSYFGAKNVCEGVSVSWEIARESGTAGYLLYRGENANFAEAGLVTDDMVTANGAGGTYTYTDSGVKAGKTYTYWLVEVGVNGQQRVYASTSLTAEGCVASTP